MRKALIVTYYWPPAGGGGVQRWLKFARYLKDFGWQPVIYAPSNASYPDIDPSLEADVPADIEVLKTPIWEVRDLYEKIVGKKPNNNGTKVATDQIFYVPKEQRSWQTNLSLWIRANLFIPDARRTWVKPSVEFLSEYLKQHKVDALITTGPPHSMHLIGHRIKSRFPAIPWVADFRDPWLEIEFFTHLPLTKRSRRKHEKLESQVLQTADVVLTVSKSWRRMFDDKGARRSEVITNGYDGRDFKHVYHAPRSNFTIAHLGTLAGDRNPEALWQSIEDPLPDVEGEDRSVELQFYGKTAPAVVESASKAGLRARDMGYVSHSDAVKAMQQSDLLLLIVNEASAENVAGRIPGKVFEYLASGTPILCLTPGGGDTADLLSEFSHAGVYSPTDIPGIAGFIKRVATGEVGRPADMRSIQQFERSELTERLAKLLDTLAPPS